jgi:acyl dehydratase
MTAGGCRVAGMHTGAAGCGHYLEDFAVGQTFSSGRLCIEKERILAFAAEFDPQPFHLDEAAARQSIFGELTASGWYTAAVSMRLLLETGLKPAGGYIGAGADGFRWPRPVRRGDELRVECEVIEVRTSNSHPERALIKVRMTTLMARVCSDGIAAGPAALASGQRGLPSWVDAGITSC